MATPAAKTGVGPTSLVAIEQLFPENQRIIQDDLARRILPFGARVFVWLMHVDFIRDWMVRATEKRLPGIWCGMMCRKRYIDEQLAKSMGRIDGLINLGAGFDTRAYRLPTLTEMPVWEVDQRENIRLKQIRLRKVLGSIPPHVRLVSVDFDRGGLESTLALHGYTRGMRTFFIWEAVTQYLTEAGIRSTFDFLAAAAPESQLVFTYIRKDFLDGRMMYAWEKGYKKFVVKNRIWLFGMDPESWPNFLKKYGWQVVEDIDTHELAEKYVKPTGRELASAPVERIIHAIKV